MPREPDRRVGGMNGYESGRRVPVSRIRPDDPATMHEVTERRRSEAALNEARAELAHVVRATTLGTLTASIAHEVNQPLSGIITNASACLRMLDADPPDVEGARETARRTIRDGNRASEVITRLCALFRRTGLIAEPVDLNGAAREVIALCASEMSKNRLVLRTKLADDLPPVLGDRVQLQQVILNLLLNASEAMSEVDNRPRHLVIRSELEAGGQVRFVVEDVGTGFDPQSAGRLFESFYSLKPNGMGIGLSVCRSIVESHGGRLWAELNDGPGARFSFSLPPASDNPAGATTLAARRRSARPKPPPTARIP